jgi:multiple sugar transport system permease protein
LWLFDGTIGVINDMLMKIDLIDRPIPWAIQPGGSFFMLFVANAWRGTPFFAIMFLAALQGINPDFYESAKIDGANGWQRFRFITLPLIRQTIIISTMLRVIWTFNYVDIIFTMTQGGPLKSTRTMTLYIYDTAFLDFNFGYAATLAAVTVILLMVFTAIYWRLGGANDDVY